jgi:hypothetical protein
LKVYNPIYAQVFNGQWVARALADLRPGFYGEAFKAWQEAQEEQKESFLLRGQALRDAETWAKGKRLSKEDERFLDDSQDVEKRDMERRLAAETEANQILTAAREQAETELETANQALLETREESGRIIKKANRRNKLSLLGALGAIAIAAIAVPISIKATNNFRVAQTNITKLNGDKLRLLADQRKLQQDKIILDSNLRQTRGKEKLAQKNLSVARGKLKDADRKFQQAQNQARSAQQQYLQAQERVLVASAQLAQVNRDRAATERDKVAAEQQFRLAAAQQQKAERAARQAEIALQQAQEEQETILAVNRLERSGEVASNNFQPTFRTLSVTTSQKRKGRESKYLSRGVSWRQAAGN